MEGGIFALIYLYYLQNKYYNTSRVPSHQNLQMWPYFPQDTWHDGASDVKHCTDLSNFEYTYSDQFHYKPERCSKLFKGESFEKLSESSMYIPTYIEDQFSDGRTDSFLVK